MDTLKIDIYSTQPLQKDYVNYLTTNLPSVLPISCTARYKGNIDLLDKKICHNLKKATFEYDVLAAHGRKYFNLGRVLFNLRKKTDNHTFIILLTNVDYAFLRPDTKVGSIAQFILSSLFTLYENRNFPIVGGSVIFLGDTPEWILGRALHEIGELFAFDTKVKRGHCEGKECALGRKNLGHAIFLVKPSRQLPLKLCSGCKDKIRKTFESVDSLKEHIKNIGGSDKYFE